VITWADEGAHWQDRVAQLQEENSVLSEQVVTRFRAVVSFHVPTAGMSNRLGSALCTKPSKPRALMSLNPQPSTLQTKSSEEPKPHWISNDETKQQTPCVDLPQTKC